MTCRLTRRRLLASSGVAIAGLAGCLGDDSDDGDGDDGAGEAPADDDSTTTGDGTNGSQSGDDADADDSGSGDHRTDDAHDGGDDHHDAHDGDHDHDLREANVTAVAIEAESGGAYRFDVTLYHDDGGEEGYANWWQVETLDGERLGRRELLHAHGTEEFTRSRSIEIPAGESCVVVRGHDQTHGYGGQAMLVNIESGATEPHRQGSERSGFDGATCP